MSSLRRLVALAAAPLLAVGLAPAATAATSAHNDARGDVVQVTFDPETEEEEVTPAPTVTDGDITRTVITHGRHRVVVTMRFRDLTRARHFNGYFVQLNTREGVRRDVSVHTWRDLQRGEAMVSRRDGAPVECAGLRHRVDRDRDLVRVSVPRTCLRDPRWIRAGVGAFRVAGDSWESTFVDDGQRDADARNRLALSPRVRRG